MSSFNSERSTTDSLHINQEQDPKIALAEGISNILTMLIEENQKNPRYDRIVRRQRRQSFSSLEKSTIRLVDYLIRIMQYTKAEETTFINALIYIDRVCLLNSLLITEYNIHRLLFSSILLSIKFNEDTYYESDYYAQIAGVSKEELLALEYDFLSLIDFKLFIAENEHWRYVNSLKSVDEKTLEG